MNEFKNAVRKAVDKSKPTQCSCPKCKGTIFLRFNDLPNGIQAMCEGCGRYWIEGLEESDK